MGLLNFTGPCNLKWAVATGLSSHVNQCPGVSGSWAGDLWTVTDRPISCQHGACTDVGRVQGTKACPLTGGGGGGVEGVGGGGGNARPLCTASAFVILSLTTKAATGLRDNEELRGPARPLITCIDNTGRSPVLTGEL